MNTIQRDSVVSAGRRSRRLSPAGAISLCAFTLLIAPAKMSPLTAQPVAHAADGVVRLAGSFNGWKTADDDYRLTRAGEALELRRRWRCGVHEFKFVYDGNWSRHLGQFGEKLAQPGQNIPLIIPQTGYYRLWLNESDAAWGFSPCGADRPAAVILAYGADTGAARVRLVGSASFARADHPIRDYRWRPLPGSEQVKITVDENRPDVAIISADRPLRFAIELTVSDGELSDRSAFSGKVGGGYDLISNTPAAMAPNEARIPRRAMLPLSPGRWARQLPVFEPLGIDVSIVRSGSDTAVAQLKRPADQSGETIVVFDERSKEASALRGGWHRFYFAAPQGVLKDGTRVETVAVAGSFNDWNPATLPLFSSSEEGTFERLIELREGSHAYKFVVNGAIWIEDPAADARRRTPNGNGGFNSGMLVGEDATTFGPPKPDAIVRPAVRHDADATEYRALIAPGLIDVSVRTLADDVQSVDVRYARTLPTETAHTTFAPARKVDSRNGFDYWTARIRVDPSNAYYVFVLSDGNDVYMIDDTGAAAKPDAPTANEPPTGRATASAAAPDEQVMPTRQRDRAVMQSPDFHTPDWAKTAVWYQIFPERFRNGDTSNDPPTTVPWQHKWYALYQPADDKPDGSAAFASGYRESGNFYANIYNRRYGGDIQGIRDKLPYLRRLGVTALYLNPIFQAESLHKYDAADYRHIDDAFGVRDSRLKLSGETTDPATWQWSESDRVFLEFLAEAHRQGFKVILDGVFNHTGREFWAFRDILKHGRKSAYADWFDVTSWKPFHYKAWDRDDGALPRLKHDEALGLAAPVRDHIFAITRRWMDPNGDGDPSDGIDGWRLDVPQDIDLVFWRDWRKLVKSINPDAYIVGEIWTEAKEWLRGDAFDAVMNYEFARSVQRFFVNRQRTITPTRFDDELRRALAWYAQQVNLVLQNLLDSHDTDRVASMLLNPDLEYDHANRIQDNGPHYNPARPTAECYHRMRLIVTFQMAYLGAPMVYYGDEVGMFGADDPSCRKPMLWDDLPPNDDPDEGIEPGLFDHYRRLIAIRNTFPALQLGRFNTLVKKGEPRVYAFTRCLDDETVAVVINNGAKPYAMRVPSPWPADARILRVDDPENFKIVEPPAGDFRGRATVRPVAGRESPVKIVDGHMTGITLPPHTAAILARAPSE